MAKSITKNYIYNVIYNICLIIVPLIVTPYISRVLTPTGIGKFSFSTSLISYFTLFASLGFSTYAQREIAKHQDDSHEQSKVFWEIIICRSVSTLIALAVNLILYFCGVYGDYGILMLIFTINIIYVLIDVSFVFQGNEEFGKLVTVNLIVRIISVVCIFVFVKNENDLWIYAIINSMTMLIGNIVLLPKLLKVLRRFPIKQIKPFRHLKGSLILFIPTIAIVIYTVLDKTLIGVLVPGTYIDIVDGIEVTKKISDLENGYYEQAEKIVKLIMTVITSIGTVMIPRNTHEIAQGKLEKVKDNVYKSFRIVWMLGVPLVLGICAIATGFVPWFFGSGYDKCIELIYILSPLILIIGFSNILGSQYLIPMGRDMQSTIPVVVGAFVNLILNVALIPRLYSVGASIATVVAEFIVVSIMVMIVRKEIKISKVLLSSWRYIVCGTIMFTVTYFFGKAFSPSILVTLLTVLLGIIVYYLMLLIMRDSIVLQYTRRIFAFLFGGKMKLTPDNVLYKHDNFKKTENNPSELVYGNLIDKADFTIAVPVYGLNRYFVDLLDNLNSLIPTSLRVQILVSDNKKYDDANPVLEKIKEYNIPNLAYYHSSEPLGQLNNFNRCVLLSKTEYVGMVHDDDLLVKNYLRIVEKVLPYLQRRKGIGLVHCSFKSFGSNEEICEGGGNSDVRIFKVRPTTVTHNGLTGTGIPSCGAIFNRAAFIDCGGFNDSYPSSGDAFLAGTMLTQKYKVYKFKTITGYYRIGANLSLRLDLCQGFIKEDELFRRSWMECGSLLRKLHIRLFGRLRYSQNIDNKVEMFSRFNPEISIESLDYLKSYKKYGKHSIVRILADLYAFTQKLPNHLSSRKIK